MRKVEQYTLNQYVKNFSDIGKTFVVETKRNVDSLYIDNKLILLTKNKNKRFKKSKEELKSIINLFAQVKKNINKYLVQIGFEIKPIEKRFSSSKTDRDKWRNLENGEVFYYIDIKHCFWRIAFLKGYISKNLYENVLTKENLKVERNMSLALIVAPTKRKYYVHGSFLCEIEEANEMYRIVYDNVRFTAYNLMGDCMEISKKNFIAYRTDGIMINKRAVKKVSKLIGDAGFNFTVKECYKIDMKHYLCDSEEKKL